MHAVLALTRTNFDKSRPLKISFNRFFSFESAFLFRTAPWDWPIITMHSTSNERVEIRFMVTVTC